MVGKNLVELVKKLRAETGVSVMECKRAVEEAGGDLKKAKALLSQRGVILAKSKSKRATTQGFVATYTHSNGKIGVVLALLCETDFVAKNPEFRQLAHELCLQIAAMAPKDKKELLAQEYIRQPGKKIATLLAEAVAKFGENIKIGKFSRIAL